MIDVELEQTCPMCLSFKAKVHVTNIDEMERANILVNGAISTHAETVHNVYAMPRT